MYSVQGFMLDTESGNVKYQLQKFVVSVSISKDSVNSN